MSSYVNSSINSSATIALEASANLASKAFHAVIFSSGKAALADGTKVPIGILIATTPEDVKAGDVVDVQVKDAGLLVVSEAVVAGDLITIAAGGQGAKATSGKHIFGIAKTAGDANSIIEIQIVHAGKA